MSLSATSGVPSEQHGTVSPKLLISMVGCILAFLAITTGFLLVARKARSMSSFSDPALPLAHNHHAHQTARRGVALPVATAVKCLACSKPSDKGLEPSRASSESLSSFTPLPPYTRHAPTGISAIRPEIWRAASSGSSAASSTTPTTPSSPSTPLPTYLRRGPTASFRHAVY